MDKYRPLIEEVAERLQEGQTVIVYCRGGLGRRGWLRLRLWWSWDIPSGDGIWIVCGVREGALEIPDQEDHVRWFEMELQTGGGSREED